MRSTATATAAVRAALTPDERRIFELLSNVVRDHQLLTTVRVAGGWVRDKLLGKESHDIDIALDNMMGHDFAQHVNGYLTERGVATHRIGVIQSNPEQSKHLETATVKVYDHWIDFVNLRSETYGDSRIPKAVFGTPLDDARRRDFTINALFYNVTSDLVEDFTERGLADLDDGVLRTPLAAGVTFRDDPLRMMRAVRFSSRLNFSMDGDLRSGLADAANHSALEKKVSRERIGSELQAMFASQRPAAAMRTIAHHGLAGAVFRIPDDDGYISGGDARWEVAARCSESLEWALVAMPQGEGTAHVAPMENDRRAAAFLGAALLPFSGMRVRSAKGREEPVAVHVVQNSLKLKSSLAKEVALVLSGCVELRALVQSDAGAESRLRAGRLLRQLKDKWFVSLYLAVAADAAAAFKSHSGDMADVAARYGRLHALLTSPLDVGGWDLERQRARPVLLNGKQIMQALGLERGGAVVGELMAAQVDWMILNPTGTAEECAKYLKNQNN